MNLGGLLAGSLGGLLTGGPIGAAVGGIGGLLGGAGGGAAGGLGDAVMQQQQQNMQNLMFQQQVNQQSQQFSTLLAGQSAAHDAIMSLLNNLGGSITGGSTNSSPSLFPPVNLTGPNFVTAAAAIARTAKVGSIALLQVYPGSGTPPIQTLALALGSLRVYFTAKADVFLYFPAGVISTALRQQLQMACGAQVTVTTTPFQQVQLSLLKK